MMRIPVTRAAGFTMVELIVVMVLIGIIAAVGIPKLMGSNAIAPVALRDEVQSGLRYAQKTAVGHRRLVCATRTGNNVSFAIATVAAADACDSALPIGITGSASVDFSAVIGSTLYFQPDGTITSDSAGATPKTGTITISGGDIPYIIRLEGGSGYVD